MNHEQLKAATRESARNFKALIEEMSSEIIEAMAKNADADIAKFKITHTLEIDMRNHTMQDKVRFSVATQSETGATLIPDPNQPELFDENES